MTEPQPRPGLEVIVLTSVAANLTAIVGGVLVFHDTIGHGPLAILARTAAFCLVILGGALMPAPVRAKAGRRASTMPGSDEPRA